MIDTEKYRIKPGSKVELGEIKSKDNGGLDKKAGKKMVHKLTKRLVELQELLYANSEKSILVIFQAMDAGGKDSTTRRVFHRLNPSGLRVKSFQAPTKREQQQDFLWRVHAHAPRHGFISIFNRSHYEDVVAVRVRELQPEHIWQNRFEHINAFEKLLSDEDTLVFKFFLHISKDYQKERLQRRLKREDKVWKFDPSDLHDREQWDHYMLAYSEAIERCSTQHSPFYIVPAERRWYRDLVVLQTLVESLESLQMNYPKADFEAADVSVT